MIEINSNPDIQKSQYVNNYDGVNNVSKSRCKGRCVNFKATRPESGSWYASGNSRCNVCNIFLTPEGIRDGLFCSCCNIRVRTRPRASAVKEKYFEQVKKMTKNEDNQSSTGDNYLHETNTSIKSEDDEDLRLEESTKEHIIEELHDVKKSTPIYEEIEKHIMN